ncbi:MAG: hypothetical protein QXX41_07895 [Nitrososphaerota archaeon]
MSKVFEAIRSVEDWRGLIAFVFSLGFFIVFIIEIYRNGGFEGVKLLTPPIMLILGFYFGEKAARREK